MLFWFDRRDSYSAKSLRLFSSMDAMFKFALLEFIPHMSPFSSLCLGGESNRAFKRAYKSSTSSDDCAAHIATYPQPIMPAPTGSHADIIDKPSYSRSCCFCGLVSFLKKAFILGFDSSMLIILSAIISRCKLCCYGCGAAAFLLPPKILEKKFLT